MKITNHQSRFTSFFIFFILFSLHSISEVVPSEDPYRCWLLHEDTVRVAGVVQVSWGNSCDSLLYDEFGVALRDSDYVQLIKKVDTIDEPNCFGNPSSNDVVVGTSKMGRGVAPGAPDGCFSENTAVNVPCNGSDTTDTFYVRAWNDSTLGLATYYGDTRQHSGQNVWVISCNRINFDIRVTDSNTWNTGTQAPNQVNVSGISISPASATPGQENVGMLNLSLSTNKNTSIWTAIKVVNRPAGTCTVDSLDIDTLKIYRESGVTPGFQPAQDTLIGSARWGPGSTAGGTATVTLSPTRTITTTTMTIYVAYDIRSTADPSHCVRACLDDSSFITVNSPDCVRNTNFPICSGDVGLPVVLSSFTATPLNEAVLLEWRTESEFENQGFHLHRATEEAGPYQQITNSLIPGAGTTPIPHDYSYLDDGLLNETTYYYKLEAVGYNIDIREFFGPISATPSSQYGSTPPNTFFLYPAKPSPFGVGNRTEFYFDLPIQIQLSLKIYDSTGKQVKTLVEEMRHPGRHREVWDGMDLNDSRVSSGVYFYRLTTPLYSFTRKVIFLK